MRTQSSHLRLLLLTVEELLNPAKGHRAPDEDTEQHGEEVDREPE